MMLWEQHWTEGGSGAQARVRQEQSHKPGAHISVARGAPSWQVSQLLPLPTQENILQKVVMTAFADRTVVTIAVRGPVTVGCRDTPGLGRAERSLEWDREAGVGQDQAVGVHLCPSCLFTFLVPWVP